MTDTQHCKTCAHWQPELPYTNEAGEDVSTGLGFCKLTESNLGDPLFPHSLAYVVDDTDYWGQLKTKENFGCVQWEEIQG